MDTRKPVKGFTTRSWGEIVSGPEAEAESAERERRMDKAFVFSGGWLTINIRYPYPIELGRIRSYKSLLSWVLHLSE